MLFEIVEKIRKSFHFMQIFLHFFQYVGIVFF